VEILILKRLIKAGARVSCHERRWLVHVTSSRVPCGISLGSAIPNCIRVKTAMTTVERGPGEWEVKNREKVILPARVGRLGLG
jgi:hypothetical protein